MVTNGKLAMADAIVLATADAIVLATAHLNNCTIITSDADLKNQSCVEFIAK